jgi:hypothetical protein
MNPGGLSVLGAGATAIAALISIALGLLNCFLGYRLFRFMLGVYGFVLGAALGVVLAGILAEGNLLVLVLAAVVCGLLGAGLMVALYFVGVFVVGAVAGALLASLVGAGLGIELPVLVTLVLAVVVGIVALFLQRVVIVLSTAFSGAWAVVSGGTSLLTGRSMALIDPFRHRLAWQRASWPLFVALLVWLVLGIVGAVVQFRTTGEEEAGMPRTASET